MKLGAIILCAGKGERFGENVPKQYQMLGEKKLYRYPLDAVLASKKFTSTLLVIGKGQERFLDHPQNIPFVEGGNTRQESVLLALKHLQGVEGVMIFEAVRPFVTQKMIESHIFALHAGAVAINTCIPTTDTINIQLEGKITAIPSRDQFLLGQTPQTFLFQPLLDAHKKTTKRFTDDCGLMIDAGEPIAYVEGSASNIKVTSPSDLAVARYLLTQSD